MMPKSFRNVGKHSKIEKSEPTMKKSFSASPSKTWGKSTVGSFPGQQLNNSDWSRAQEHREPIHVVCHDPSGLVAPSQQIGRPLPVPLLHGRFNAWEPEQFYIQDSFTIGSGSRLGERGAARGGILITKWHPCPFVWRGGEGTPLRTMNHLACSGMFHHYST